MSYKGKSFKPHADKLFVSELETGPRKTATGIIIIDDNMSATGVRDRWGKVWAVGANITDVVVGEWVLVKHGRWTHGIDLELDGDDVRVWHVEFPDAVLIASDVDPRITQPTTL